MPTEIRLFVGEAATQVVDGYAGFRLGQRYELEVEHQPDGSVHVTIPHGAPRGPMVLTAQQWARWFQKP